MRKKGEERGEKLREEKKREIIFPVKSYDFF